MSERTLVLGAGGMLATSLEHLVRDRRGNHDWVFLTIDDLDITHADRVRATLRDQKPTWVINASGFTDVDGAESDAEAARLLNGTAVGVVSEACRSCGATLIHFSTDYVFSGASERPWREDDAPAPINEYGWSKLAGERAVRESGVEHLIIRTSWLYAAHGHNFVRTILGRLRSSGKVRVVHDQRGRPTCSDDLAIITADLMGKAIRGTIHAANDGEATWYEFACAIRDLAAPGAIVEPCASAEYPTAAARPCYSTLDLDRLASALGRPPRHWRDALRDVIGQIGAGARPGAAANPGRK